MGQYLCEICDVIYSFTCSEDSCNSFYVGYTLNNLLVQQHRDSSSSLYKIFALEHNKLQSKYDQLKESFRVLYKS